MKEIRGGVFTGERALFTTKGARIFDAVFEDGESPLKESEDIELFSCSFKWKYPLWYCKNILLRDSAISETARSGIWYTDGIEIENTKIEAPKTFRRAKNISLKNVSLPHADETLWSCEDIRLDGVSAVGDYFGMNSRNVVASNFILSGNYAFDGAENVTVTGAKMLSKDAFWNCRNVTVRDSYISGEYLGWNSENVTFINCTLDSNQGLCYMENVRLVNCRLEYSDLTFEYSSVDAEIIGNIVSVKNPKSGRVVADSFGEVKIESEYTDPEKINVAVRGAKDCEI